VGRAQQLRPRRGAIGAAADKEDALAGVHLRASCGEKKIR
jgi:hypothetical protein